MTVEPPSVACHADPRFLERKLVVTGDGSHSLYLPALDEHYHSSHGALRESRHVFIRHGYEEALAFSRLRLQILEMGFGTGLNALLTWDRSAWGGVSVSYTALEALPVAAEVAARLNYADWLTYPLAAREIFAGMHRCAWGASENFGEHFSLLKLRTTLEAFHPVGEYDLVYYDAFSPQVQPELWGKALFDKLIRCMSPGAVLVTYCAKGEVKRNLKAAGFTLENLPGPPGKREMTRARKP